uniref:sterol desaturase family protein n=1 Tax=Flavobacterium sp. TaxID=239 RepID=UPI00404A12F6
MDAIKWYFLVFVLAAVIAEIIWSNYKKNDTYNLHESAGNLGIFIGNQLIKPISVAFKYMVLEWIAQYKIFDIPMNFFTIIISFLAVELIYYWYHRLSHEIPLLWTLHHTHHSALKFNLTTAVRLNWLGLFISPLFYIPLVLLGLSPEVIVTCLAVGLFYQYFLHTEAIKKLGIFEGMILNTPSAHRVHHGSNEKYIDKNYGAMLIIFDKLFGTYQKEEEKVKYGVTSGFFSNNPLIINFRPLVAYFRGNWKREKQRIKSDIN